MNPEMEENLQDLKDIRNHMYRYYDVGQEYIRQQEILERYEKAEERWAPKNKKKILLISIGICILLGPVGIMLGPFAVGGLYFGYEKITAEKIRLRKKKEDELNALLKQYEESYRPVAKKCKRLLFHREEYEISMAVDYLIQIIQTGRVDTMREAYDKLDEQLHRWTMEKLQNQQIEIQLYQCRLLQQIIALDIVNSWD